MTQERRTYLKDLMNLAWSLFRAEQNGPNPRTFADALAGAWQWTKSRAERVAANQRWLNRASGREVSFGSMLQSPIRRSLTGQVYAGRRAWEAGRVTTSVGR